MLILSILKNIQDVAILFSVSILMNIDVNMHYTMFVKKTPNFLNIRLVRCFHMLIGGVLVVLWLKQ